jgi:hypothetical protein
MKVATNSRQWVVAAAALAVGVPVVTVIGAILTSITGAIVGLLTFGSPPTWTLQALLVAGCLETCVLLWFLVGRCVRVGGWRTLGVGLGGVGVFAVASYALGTLSQAVAPPSTNGMAGTAWIVLGYLLGVLIVLAFIMGALVIRIDVARSEVSTRDAAAGLTKVSS